jgi:mono/diheme cytochrome c family protein
MFRLQSDEVGCNLVQCSALCLTRQFRGETAELAEMTHDVSMQIERFGMFLRKTLILCATLSLCFEVSVVGSDVERQARFKQTVGQIVERRCAKCHGEEKQKSDLQLTTLDGVLAGGGSGAIVQPGRPDESLIMHLITPDGDPHMPPEGQLSDREIAAIEAWIRTLPLDLKVGSARGHGSGEDHWSFQKPERPAVPDVASSDRASTPIDAFILARLEADGATLSRPATSGELIRRAAFDLTGLPPLRDEVQSFESDFQCQPDGAVEALLNRLLASPHYGERWGRHWLDLARYADSNGFEFDFERPHAWHYRDWVINSFNTDKPYDEFLAEQIAGDEISPGSFPARVATGFCRHGPTVGNQQLEKHRWDELDDVISTTSEVFLGLTLGCARCHDHKYDPISQRDYYAMLAVFNSIRKRSHFMGTPNQKQTLDRLNTSIREHRKRLTKLTKQPSAGDWVLENRNLVQRRLASDVRLVFGSSDWTDYTVEVDVQKTDGTREPLQYEAGVSLMVRAASLEQFYWLRLGVSDNREHGLDIADDGGHAPLTRKISGTLERGRWYRLRVTVLGPSIRAWVDDQLVFEIQHARHTTGRIGFGNWSATSRWRNLTVRGHDGSLLLNGFPDLQKTQSPAFTAGSETVDDLNQKIRRIEAQVSALPLAMSIVDESGTPRETRLFLRGDYRTPGPVVQPAVPAVLTKSPVPFPAAPEEATSTRRRRAFATWLASPDNPLTARVMVNRIWQYHFGCGLVDTASNFGLRGSQPSHPELLDWLAVEFIESDWSIKHIHRLIMTSAVYRQSRRGIAGNGFREDTAADSENRLLSRFPTRRLEAELIRDRILAASGSLNRTMYGPGIRPRIHPGVIATSTTRKWPTVERESSEHWRRSVYIFVRRSVLMPMLEAFDSPTTTQSCEQRLTTTVPTQALQLMNDRFTGEQAAIMARRVIADVGQNAEQQVREVYWRSLSREPTDDELSDCVSFLRSQRKFHAGSGEPALADLCHVTFNLNEFVYVD